MNERERATLERQIEDLRSDRNKWWSVMAEKQTKTVKLLADQAQKARGGRLGRAWAVLTGKS